jgi:hypothetical protein
MAITIFRKSGLNDGKFRSADASDGGLIPAPSQSPSNPNYTLQTETITSNSTWTPPRSNTRVDVIVVAGGGSGGTNTGALSPGGGGAGGYIYQIF